MADQRGGSERKNYIIKTLLIVVLLLLALLSTVFYVYAYPKSTVTLYSICGTNQQKEESFQIKKYSAIGSLKPIEKFGYDFEYWAYDIAGYDRFDGDKEVDVDYLDLFGMYTLKEFNIKLWIQEYDGETKLDTYGYNPVTYENVHFNETQKLWNGLDANGELDSRLQREGYDFVGWSTKVQGEDSINETDIIRVKTYTDASGKTETYAKFVVLQDSEVNLYAYWERRTYDVVTHTGNEYQMDGDVPARENGNFIIRNNSVVESFNQGLGIKYLNDMSTVTTVAEAHLLNADGYADDTFEDNGEYRFVGWYLDEDYTVPATDDLTVRIIKDASGVEVPYLVSSAITNPTTLDGYRAEYNSDTQKYEFHLYSKWERKSYTVTFKKNLGVASSSIDIAPIKVYKFDSYHGKYYQTAEVFTRENQNSEYFYKLDLSSTEITTTAFKDAFSSYRFMGWSLDSKASTNSTKYYYWYQDTDSVTVDNYKEPTYLNEIYTHEVSEDVTLYAQWSTIRTITFYQKTSASASTARFTIQGVAGEWFVLPGKDYVVDELGWSNKSYNFFAGWKESSYATPIYEYAKGSTGDTVDQNSYKLDSNGNKIKNQNYICVIGSKSINYNYYAYWENKIYTVNFYRNDGTKNKVDTKSVRGGNTISFPASPTRDYYIFDGWSTTPYPDNAQDKTLITSATATGEDQVISIYATWTMNFVVKYDKTYAKKDLQYEYSKIGKDLKMSVQLSNASSWLSRSGYTFDKWYIGSQTVTFSPGTKIIFDFKTMKYYISGTDPEKNPEKAYDFTLSGEGRNEVVISATWKANKYKVTIVDTMKNKKTVVEVSYADSGVVDLNADNIIASYLGYQFTHLSTKSDGTGETILPDEDGKLWIENNKVLSNLTYYTNYKLRIINVSYQIKDVNGSEKIYTPPSSNYSQGDVKYGATLVLPTPSSGSDFGDSTYLFQYWYYIVGEGEEAQEVIVESNKPLIYDGDNLVLWAKFEKQVTTVEFQFKNPFDSTDTVTISTRGDNDEKITVEKNSIIDQTFYDEIMGKINAIIKDRFGDDGIKEYTLDGLFYTYYGQKYLFKVGNTYSNDESKIVYVTSFSPNVINFVYEFKNAHGTQTYSAHSGNNYSSATDIIVESASKMGFTYEEGQSINGWYILKADGSSRYPIQLGSYIVKTSNSDGFFRSIADMADYIVWSYNRDTKKYEGTITIHAETEKTIEIEYYALQGNGELKNIFKDSETYKTLGNSTTLLTSKEALDGFVSKSGLTFNGWRVYSSNGLVTSLGENGLINDVLEIDTASIFTDLKVRLYADISYTITFSKVVQSASGAFSIVELKEYVYPFATSGFNMQSSYSLSHTLNTTLEPVTDIPEGYDYYGYKIGDEVYSQASIASGESISITGEKINILCYITRNVTFTYTVDGTKGETFADGTSSDKTETFVIDYENKVVAKRSGNTDTKVDKMTIADFGGKKTGYTFAGWAIKSGDAVSSDVQKGGAVVYLYEDTNFVAVFEEPKAGTLTAKFRYVYLDSNGDKHVLKEETKDNINGKSYTLLGEDDVDYSDVYTGITGWTYLGQTMDGEFAVPTLIDNGEEFEFVAIIKNKYTIIFETYSVGADSTHKFTTVIYDDEITYLNETPILDDGKTFIAWLFTLKNGDEIEIGANDAIKFRASTANQQSIYSCVTGVNYNLHNIPADDGYTYTFRAKSENISLTLIAKGVGEDGGDVSKTILDVPFGHSYEVRDLVELADFGKYETGKGIIAWTTDGEHTDYSYYDTDAKKQTLKDNITGIGSNRTLYAVWQTKHSVTYGVDDENKIAYQTTISTEHYFAGADVAFNASVLKSVYFKGYNTVYFDNGQYIVYANTTSGNDYYMVTGYTVKYATGSISKSIDEWFNMPDADVTIIPTFEQVHSIKFYSNTGSGDPTSEELIDTIYAVDLSKIDLSQYTTTRENFTFAGWALSRDGEKIDSIPENSKAVDTALYAVWNSDIYARFMINGSTKVFDIPLTRESKIDKAKLENYLSLEDGSQENGYLKQISLNGNARTYSFNDIYYYLNHFVFGGHAYTTTSDICDIVFESSVTINMVLYNVYTIKYFELNELDILEELTDVSYDYFVSAQDENGAITSTGRDGNITFAKYESSNTDYYTAIGWEDSSEKEYLFGYTLKSSDYEYLKSFGREIGLTLKMEANSIDIILYAVDDPYALYSTVVDEESAKLSTMWQDVANTYVKDYSGNDIAGTKVSLPFGSRFNLSYPESPSNNYQIVGWTTSLLKLGDTGNKSDESIYFSNNYLSGNGVYSSSTLTLSQGLIGTSKQLILYPVYQLVTMHEASIVATDGEFSFKIENDESVLKGYIGDYANTVTEGKLEALDCEFAYYQKLIITADSPRNNYSLSTFTHNGDNVDGGTLTISGRETNLKHRVVIEYTPKTITVSLKLNYSMNLKNGTDTSTLTVGSATLSASNTTANISVLANEKLVVSKNLSEYYTLQEIKSGDTNITLVDSSIDLSELQSENDALTIDFTLSPKTHTVELNLQEGKLNAFTYSSDIFGDGNVTVSGSSVEIISGAKITLGTPTKEKHSFLYYTIDGARYDDIKNYTVNSDISIVAFFTKNRFYVEYQFNDGSSCRFESTLGDKITIGKNIDMSEHTTAGVKHLGWKLLGDSSETLYKLNDTFTVPSKDCTFIEQVSGENVTITFVNESGTTLGTKTVEYNAKFNLPEESDFANASISGKSLYGYKLGGGDIIYQSGKEITISNRDSSTTNIYYSYTDGKITLVAVYYNQYKYTINYEISREYSSTTIASDTVLVSAIASGGDVDPSDLTFTISSDIPVASSKDFTFAGYTLKINGILQTESDGEKEKIYNAGEKISLVNPNTYEYTLEYVYTLSATFKSTAELRKLEIVVNNPLANGNLELTYDGGKGDSYTMYVNAQAKLYLSNLPFPDYTTEGETISWMVGKDTLFTTSESGIVAYKLVGYLYQYVKSDNTLSTGIEMRLDGTDGLSITDGASCRVTTIWETRYSVTYYDENGTLESKEYFDKNTILQIDGDSDKYSKDGYIFVGYVESKNREITSVSDFYAFDTEFEMTRDYAFYPAFSKVYTAKFHDNLEILSNSHGDSAKAKKIVENELLAYIGMEEVQLSDYYAWIYTDIGYSFDGLTIIADKMSNDLKEEEILSDTFTLDIKYITNEELNIYVAWGVEEKTITFEISALKNDTQRSYYSTTPLEMTYRYNETIGLSDDDYAEIIKKFQAETLNSDTTYIINNFEFRAFSTSRDGSKAITSYDVKSDAKIYLVYDYKYTITYNIGSATYVTGAETVKDTSGLVGDTISGYDAQANLLLEGKGGLFWTPIVGKDIHFFDESLEHTLSDSDRQYADEDYIITLYIRGDVAKYTVNLYYFENKYSIENKDTDPYGGYVTTPITMSLDYGSSIIEFQADEYGEVSGAVSPFDEEIAKATNYNSLFELLNMFNDDGYEYNGRIRVNDSSTMYISKEYDANYYYTVKTYSSETVNAYTNNVYLVYSLTTYTIKVNTLVFESAGDITTPSKGYTASDVVSTLQIRSDSEEDFYTLFFSSESMYAVDRVTRKSDIRLVYESDEALEYNEYNISYTFWGYRVAIVDGDGNVTGFQDVVYGENWKNGSGENVYRVVGDVEVYAIFIERPINVTFTYIAPEDIPADKVKDISTQILLNGKEVGEDKLSYTTTATEKIVTFKALYGQQLYVSSSEADGNYYVIKNIIVNSVATGNKYISTSLTSESGSLDSFDLSVVFETVKVNVYAFTGLEENVFSTYTYATISSVTVHSEYWGKDLTISSTDDIYEEFTLNTTEGRYYNYVIRIPLGTTITGINASLNNFTISAWYEYNGTNKTPFESLAVDSSKYISAELVADTIDVVFYTSDDTTPISLGRISNITYGSKITLPCIVVDEGTAISTGWNIGDEEYYWGDTINAVHPENEDVNGILHILARVTQKYYLAFTNATGHTFDVPEDYRGENNATAITEDMVAVDAGSYYFYNVADGTYEEKTVDEFTTIFSDRYTIPEELLFDNSFGGWLTKSGDIVVDYYDFDSNDIEDGTHKIILNTTLSGIVAVKFYITNPLDTTEDLKLATTATGNYNIECIQAFYDKDDDYFSFVTISENNSTIIKWSANYFVTVVENLLDNYTFYGWSQTRRDVLSDPSHASISDGALLYSWGTDKDSKLVRTTLDRDTLNANILAILQDENCSYTFYTVWEEKKTIVFDATDSNYTNGKKIEAKYASGEEITMPNNLVSSDNESYLDLKWNSNKWVGWMVKDSNTQYRFDEYAESDYIIYAPTSNTVLVPMWESGASVYFDINFDGVRAYFAQALASNGKGSYDTNYAYTAYPYILDGDGYTAEISSERNALVVNGEYTKYAFITRYREGAFWSAGDQVPVYKYDDSVFTHAGIYTKYGTLDKYFNLIGWMYNGQIISTVDEDGRIVLNLTEEMISSANGGQIVLTAYWRPIDLEVTFYYDKTSATNGDVGSQYYAENADGDIEFITVKVPFGYKLTSVEDYVKDIDTLNSNAEGMAYIYSGLASGMSSPINKTVNVINQDFYILNHWENYSKSGNVFNNISSNGYDANTTSDRLIDNMRLYPVFDIKYKVQFVSSTGEILDDEISQRVVDGEDILILSKLQTVLDINVLRSVEYQLAVGTKVSLMNGKTPVEKVTFSESQFKIEDTYYVNIYVDINMIIRAYTPTYSGSSVTATQHGEDIDIYQNNSYRLLSLFYLTDEELNAYGNGSNNPTFDGWYLSALSYDKYYSSDEYQRIDITSAESINVVTERKNSKIVYYVEINGENDNRLEVKAQDGGLVVCVYAKLYVQTTITLGDNDNSQDICKYAELSYNTELNQYYSIEDSVVYDNKIKTITYLTTYNSSYAPDITVTPIRGYQISTITGVTGEDLTTLKDSAEVNKTINSETFNMSISKSIVIVEDSRDGNEYDRYQYILNINHIRGGNNYRFAIEIEVISYTITYQYGDDVSALNYQESRQYRWKSFAESSGSITFEIDYTDATLNSTYIYTNGNMRSAFTVNYTFSRDESSGVTSITLSGVPYGYPVYIQAIVKDELMHHFDSWVTEDLSATDTLRETSQIFTPSIKLGANDIVKEITIEARLANNEVTSIEYQLIFDVDEDDTAWYNLVSQCQQLNTSGSGGSIRYVYNWTPSIDVSQLGLKAGDSLSDLYTIIQNTYNKSFNTTFSTASEGNSSYDIDYVLNYFWFNNIWNVSPSNQDKCQIVKGGSEDIIKVSYDGGVYIYTNMEMADVVVATHRVQDYLSDDILKDSDEKDFDRADIALNSVALNGTTSTRGVDYFVLQENANKVIVKLPYGSRLTFTVSAVGATNEHVAYTTAGWRYIDAKTTSPSIEDGTTVTLNTREASSYFVDGVATQVGQVSRIIPELHISASVTAQTYDLYLKNDDDTTIDTLKLAYDRELADAGYSQFASTLEILRDSARLPLFELDSKAVLNSKNYKVFRSSLDANISAKQYGYYSQLFAYWEKLNGNKGQEYGARTEIKTFSNGNYFNVTLNAHYLGTKTVQYQILSGSGYTAERYLPASDYENQFGDIYSSALLWKSVVDELGDSGYDLAVEDAIVDSYKYTNKDTIYYTYRKDILGALYAGDLHDQESENYQNTSDSFTLVNTLEEVIDLLGSQDTYTIYPTIDTDLTILDSQDKTSLSKTYTIRAIGGVYTVFMQGTGTSGTLEFRNTISVYGSDGVAFAENRISHAKSEIKPFAYWEVVNKDDTIDYNIGGSSHIIDGDTTISAHYNAVITIDNTEAEGKGSVEINGGSNAVVKRPLSSKSTPTKTYFSPDDMNIDALDITQTVISINRHIDNIQSGVYTLTVVDETNGNTLYTAVYTYVPGEDNLPATDITFVWKISTEDTGSEKTLFLISTGDQEIVKDSWGAFTITPVVFPKEVEVSLVDMNIDNVESTSVMQKYSNLFTYSYSSSAQTVNNISSSQSFTLKGGSLMTVTGNEKFSGGSFSSTLTLSPIDGSAVTTFTATWNGTNSDNFKLYTFGYHWQYFYDNEWQDIESGVDRIIGNNGVTQIRLSCEWQMIEIGVNIYTYKLNNHKSTLSIQDTFVKMLLGDQIEYDREHETLTFVRNGGGWTDDTPNVVVYGNIASGEYSQGWFKYRNDIGDALMGDLTITIDDKYNNRYQDFALWVEKAISITAIMAQTGGEDGTVYGYGDVAIYEQNKKTSSLEIESVEVNTTSKSYLNDYIVGVSTIVSFSFDMADNGHEFVSCVSDIAINGVTQTTVVSAGNGYTLSDNTTFSIMYDASKTKTHYVIADKIDTGDTSYNAYDVYKKYSMDIYGGYTFAYSYTKSGTSIQRARVEVIDFYGVTVDIINIYLNIDGTTNGNNVYINHNYHADELMYYNLNNTLFEDDAEVSTKVSVAKTSLSNGVKALDNVTFNAKTNKPNTLLVCLEDYLYAIDFYVKTSILDGEEESISWGINEKALASNVTLSDYHFTVVLNNSDQFSILRSRKDGNNSMILKYIGSEYNFAQKNEYKLLGMDIYKGYDVLSDKDPIKTEYFGKSDTTLESTAWGEDSLTLPQYTLLVRTEYYTYTSVGFKLTLPYLSDIRELNITSTLYTAVDENGDELETTGVKEYTVDDLNNTSVGQVRFNDLSLDGGSAIAGVDNALSGNSNVGKTFTLNYTFRTYRDVYVRAQSNGNRYTIYFYRDSKCEQSIGYISYTLPNIYEKMGTNGWFVDNSNYASMQSAYVDASGNESTARAGYISWIVDASTLTEVKGNAIKLSAQSAIVLGVTRKQMTIYVDTSASWWSQVNDGGDNSIRETNAIENQDDFVGSSYLTYSYMAGHNFDRNAQEISTYGGLALVVPTTLGYNGTSEALYTAANMLAGNTSGATNVQPATIHPVKSSFYVYYGDESLVGKATTNGTATTVSGVKSPLTYSGSGIVSPVFYIVGENSGYNIELNTSTTWFVTAIPSGDSGVDGPEYTTVTFQNTLGGKNLGTYNFVSGKITLLQSIVSWIDRDYTTINDARQRTFSIYLAKDTTTRLYNGMHVDFGSNMYFNGLQEVSNPFTPSGNSYYGVNVTFTSSIARKDKTKHLVLAGYKIYSATGTLLGTVDYEDFIESGIVSGQCTLDLSKYSRNITIIPTWQEKSVYTLNILSQYTSSSLDLIQVRNYRLLEGSTYSYSVTLGSKEKLTSNVTSQGTTSGTYNVAKYNANKSTSYIFMGLTTLGTSSSSRLGTMYATTAGKGKDSNFDNYGAYRIAKDSSGTAYSLVTNNTAYNSNVRNGAYSISITMDSDLTLYAVWQKLGYSVSYVFNNKSYLGYTGYSLNSNVKDKTDSITITVKNDTYLQTMPFRVGDGVKFSGTKTYGTDGWTIKDYFNSKSATTALALGSLRASTQNTIYFSLIHNVGHDSHEGNDSSFDKSNKLSEHLCALNEGHGYKYYYNYSCKYCSRIDKSYTGETKDCDTTTKYEYDNDSSSQHYKRVYCACTACKNTKYRYSTTQSCTKKYTVIKEATCTTGGSKQEKCSVCGKTFGKVVLTDPLGHLFTYDTSKYIVVGDWRKYGTYDCLTSLTGWYQECSRDNCNHTKYSSGNKIYQDYIKTLNASSSSLNASQVLYDDGGNPWGHRYDYTKAYDDGDHTKSCSKGFYVYHCKCCTSKTTANKTCTYDYETFQLVRSDKKINYPDEYNCRGYVWSIKFPCVNCGNSYKKSDKVHEDAIRLRINMLQISDWGSAISYVGITDINSIALAEPHQEKKIWTGPFSYYYKCEDCGKRLVKSESGNSFVLEHKSLINYVYHDYVLEFQPRQGAKDYVYSLSGSQYGYGATYRRSEEVSDNYGYSTYWKYWTEKWKYSGWWAIVSWDYNKKVLGYRTDGIQNGLINGLGYQYEYAVMYQTISGAGVQINVNSQLAPGQAYRYFPYEMSETKYKNLITKLSKLLYNGTDNRSDTLKKNAPHQTLIFSSNVIYRTK